MGKDWPVNRAGFFPSPLVGEGGSIAQGAIETDEGSVSAERTPHPALRATVSHKGRRKTQFPVSNEHVAPPPAFCLIWAGSSVQFSFERLSATDPAAPSAAMPVMASVAKISL